MTVQFDPSRAIDLSVAPPRPRPARFGWFGPYPSRPCDRCGHDEFQAGDWNLGFRCVNCGQTFGTPQEWLY